MCNNIMNIKALVSSWDEKEVEWAFFLVHEIHNILKDMKIERLKCL